MHTLITYPSLVRLDCSAVKALTTFLGFCRRSPGASPEIRRTVPPSTSLARCYKVRMCGLVFVLLCGKGEN